MIKHPQVHDVLTFQPSRRRLVKGSPSSRLQFSTFTRNGTATGTGISIYGMKMRTSYGDARQHLWCPDDAIRRPPSCRSTANGVIRKHHLFLSVGGHIGHSKRLGITISDVQTIIDVIQYHHARPTSTTTMQRIRELTTTASCSAGQC